ncbi:hypothetical protein TNCV_4455661 [Trichonephila clavipes]|nr:hypothetical protein TNCV_4455661 [Trichonephila clavipes]
MRDRLTETYSTSTEEHKIFYDTNDDPSIEQKGCAAFHSRRESISGVSSTSFPEDTYTFIPYSGFQPKPTRLQAEWHIHHTGWGGDSPPARNICSCIPAPNDHVYWDGHSRPWPSWAVASLILSFMYS